MRKFNYSLFFGILLLILILVLINFKYSLITYDPYSSDLNRVEMIDGEFVIREHPEPPSKTNYFGTDILGRDIYSQIIYGASITLKIVLLATVAKFIIAIPLAYLGAFGSKIFESIINFFSSLSNAIPSLILCIILLSNGYLKNLELQESIYAFAAVFTFVGVGRPAKKILEKGKEILKMNFIKGEITTGKSKFQIAWQNLTPHILPYITVDFFFELSATLLLLAELGVFSIYVGKSLLDSFTQQQMPYDVVPPFNPEWGGMLSSARIALTLRKPWIAVFPASAFFVSIMCFNFLGEGLKNEVEKRDSKIITYINRFFFYISPKTFIKEIKDFKNNRKTVAAKSGIILLLMFIVFKPPFPSKVPVNTENIQDNLLEVSRDYYEGRETNTNKQEEFSQYISKKFEKYNLKPLFEDNYISEKNVESYSKSLFGKVYSSSLIVEDENKQVIKEFQKRVDYSCSTYFYTMENDKPVPINNLRVITIPLSEYKRSEAGERNIFLLIDDNKDSLIGQARTKAMQNPNIRGVLIPVDENKYLKYGETSKFADFDNDNKFLGNYARIYISQELKNYLLSNNNKILNYSNDFKLMRKVKIMNVGGYIQGKDDSNPVVITTNYDYFGFSENIKHEGLLENGSSVASILEVARVLSELKEVPDRTVIFLFTDGRHVEELGAKKMVFHPYIDKETFFIYVNYLGLENSENVYVDTSYITKKDPTLYKNIGYLSRRASNYNLDFNEDRISSPEPLIYKGNGSFGIIYQGLSANKTLPYIGEEQNDLNDIDIEILKRQTQVLTDTLYKMNYNN
ncbi:MAG: M28 family peptidase [Bacillota bacterium]|nr:M28 family peptidase [Bacillota bacterium]MDW7667320.1 M28 family peptidase [Bacillota bacterium]